MTRNQAWGLGGPQLVRPSTTDEYEKVAGLFDLHYPRQHKRLWGLTMDALDEVRPHRVVIGGDATDNPLISRWQERKRQGMPQGKVTKMAKKDLEHFAHIVFGDLRDRLGPDVVIDFCEGNHDERARLWFDDDLQAGIDDFREAMMMTDYNVNWHPRAGFKLRDQFIIKHGNYTIMHNAKKEFDSSKCGGWSGHKHHRTHWEETHHETHRRWEWVVAPVMSRVDYDYGPGQSGLAPWPQGFLLGDFSTKDQFDHHTDVARYWKGTLMCRGKQYK